MTNTYAIKYETSRPAGNWRDTIQLTRKWALVRMNKSYGYTVVSRFGSKEAAERALSKAAA